MMSRATAGCCLTILGWLATACAQRSGAGKACEGEETCACYPNETCNDGLRCLSNLCVAPEKDDDAAGDDDNADDDDEGDSNGRAEVDDDADGSGSDDNQDAADDDDRANDDEDDTRDDADDDGQAVPVPDDDESASDDDATGKDDTAGDDDDIGNDDAKGDDDLIAADDATGDDTTGDDDDLATADDDTTLGDGAAPIVLIVADRSSAMDAVSGTSSNPWAGYSSRWEALRATVASLEPWSDAIDFAALTYFGDTQGTCPVLESSVATGFGLDGALDLLSEGEPPDYEGVKREAPTAAGLAAALEILADTPDRERYILLITKGTPDTCAVPDPQCGGDPAVGVIQSAYADGIKTIVVAMEDDDDSVANDMAHAGQGLNVEPLDVGSELYCVVQELEAVGFDEFDYDDWRSYTEGEYGPDDYTYSSTRYYDVRELDVLRDVIADIADGRGAFAAR